MTTPQNGSEPIDGKEVCGLAHRGHRERAERVGGPHFFCEGCDA